MRPRPALELLEARLGGDVDPARVHAVRFGASVVERLLPHRPPMRMVDGVDSFAAGPPPSLSAWREVASDEPWCEGHFPGLAVLPGVLVIEGLAQASGLLRTLRGLADALEAGPRVEEELRDGLASLERQLAGARDAGGAAGERLDGLITERRALGLGALVSTRVKLVRPVVPGERLLYQVTHRKQVERLCQFDVRAVVDGELVAEGTIALGWLELPRPRGGRGGAGAVR